MVKADGYGLGAGRGRGRALGRPAAGSFFVAHLEEGRALRARAAGGRDPRAERPARRDRGRDAPRPGLIPVLNHPGELAALRGARARGRGARLPAALQIDTGMCRLGFAAAELERLDAGAARSRSTSCW